jgi:hypothetical protein
MVCYVLFNNQWPHYLNKPKQRNLIHLKILNPPIIIIFYHDESKKINNQFRFHLVTKVKTYKQINKRQMVIMQHKNNNEMGGYEVLYIIRSTMIFKVQGMKGGLFMNNKL